ncbi:MAG: biopolymer transporter ExbD [Polyangiales bacterium]
MAGMGPSRGGSIEGINVTPLVDIVLVLLIIFIVTAKFVVTPAVPLDLPQASQSEEVQTVLAVTLTADGAVSVDGQALDDAGLAARARAALAEDGAVRAVIHADGDARHRSVVGVLDTLKANGVTRVAFATVRPAADEHASVRPPEGAPSTGSPESEERAATDARVGEDAP